VKVVPTVICIEQTKGTVEIVKMYIKPKVLRSPFKKTEKETTKYLLRPLFGLVLLPISLLKKQMSGEKRLGK